MNRRNAGLALLIGLLATGAAPLAAETARAGKVYRIGYLSAPTRKSVERALGAFLRALRELGWVECQNLVIELSEIGGLFPWNFQVVNDEFSKPVGDAPCSRIGDQGGNPMFARGGTRSQKPSEAPSVKSDLPAIHNALTKSEIDDCCYYAIPVRAEVDALLIQHPSLSRAIKEKAVIAAAGRRYRRSEIHVRHCSVVTVGKDDERSNFVFMADRRNQVRGHACFFEWNAY